jgi:hypothetical protein
MFSVDIDRKNRETLNIGFLYKNAMTKMDYFREIATSIKSSLERFCPL